MYFFIFCYIFLLPTISLTDMLHGRKNMLDIFERECCKQVINSSRYLETGNIDSQIQYIQHRWMPWVLYFFDISKKSMATVTFLCNIFTSCVSSRTLSASLLIFQLVSESQLIFVYACCLLPAFCFSQFTLSKFLFLISGFHVCISLRPFSLWSLSFMLWSFQS